MRDDVDVIGEIRRRCGDEAALRLADRLGGLRIYVPRSPGPEHRLRVAVGDAVTEALVAIAGGGEISIPRARAMLFEERAARIVRLAAEGRPNQEIAREVGVTPRWVRQVLARNCFRVSPLRKGA